MRVLCSRCSVSARVVSHNHPHCEILPSPPTHASTHGSFLGRILVVGLFLDGLGLGLSSKAATAQVSRVGSWTTGLTHTVGTGNDRLLVFAVGYEENNSNDVLVNAVTYGGQSLTRIVEEAVESSNRFIGRIELWYLNEAGIVAATNSTFVVTFGGSGINNEHYGAATYENVDQTSPVFDFATNSTPGSTPNPIETTVNVADGHMAIAAALCGKAGSGYTWGNGWTEGFDFAASSSASSTAENLASATGTDTASATHSSPEAQSLVAATLAPTCVATSDSDGDGLNDCVDACPNDPNNDADADGLGNPCDTDDDNDGVDDTSDNCPTDDNPGQEDADFDGIGDICDPLTDTDFDGIANSEDNCPFDFNTDQDDIDGDGIGTLCDPDNDNDGVPDVSDNCIVAPNPGQEDWDADSIGDVCDPDDDNDSVIDDIDNCPLAPNADQADATVMATATCARTTTGMVSSTPTTTAPSISTRIRLTATMTVSVTFAPSSSCRSCDRTPMATCVRISPIRSSCSTSCSGESVFPGAWTPPMRTTTELSTSATRSGPLTSSSSVVRNRRRRIRVRASIRQRTIWRPVSNPERVDRPGQRRETAVLTATGRTATLSLFSPWPVHTHA